MATGPLAACGIGCAIIQMIVGVVVIVYGMLEFTIDYQPEGSCSGLNTQKWINETKGGLYGNQYETFKLEYKKEHPLTHLDLNHEPDHLMLFTSWMIQNDETEACQASCAGDFRIPILLTSISFIWTLLMFFCIGLLFIRNLASNEAMGIGGVLLCGVCSVAIFQIAAGISQTVVQGQTGAWEMRWRPDLRGAVHAGPTS